MLESEYYDALFLLSIIIIIVVPVHSVAAEIAKIHNVSLDKIINKLTEVWNEISILL